MLKFEDSYLFEVLKDILKRINIWSFLLFFLYKVYISKIGEKI